MDIVKYIMGAAGNARVMIKCLGLKKINKSQRKKLFRMLMAVTDQYFQGITETFIPSGVGLLRPLVGYGC